jgi:integrase
MTTAKRMFTDKFVRSLRPAPAGQLLEFWDDRIRGFGVRVSDKGLKTFVLYRRFPPSTAPVRRKIGNADEITLSDARTIAADWVRKIGLGVDPKEEKRRAQLAEQQRRKVTFQSVAEAWFADALRAQRQGRVVELTVRRECFPAWGARPMTDVTALDVRALVKAKAERAPASARNVLGHVRRLYSWAIAQQIYGVTEDPTEKLRPKQIIGKKPTRQRVLDDTELRALWRAAARTPYPYGPLFQMLMLTGQRKSEIAEARWREFDLDKKVLTIPPERMKGGSAHVVPLTSGVLDILTSGRVQRFKKGDHLFSTSFGAERLKGFSKAKERLDRRMLRTLRAMARQRGDDPSVITLKPFVIHDIRRTMRTGLSALPIPDIVRELLIAHAQKGMHRIYDLYAYADEKRHALQIWEQRLRGIVDPPPIGRNVVAMRRA